VVVDIRVALTDPHWRLWGISFHAVDPSPRDRVDAASGLRLGRHWRRVHIAGLDALPPPAGASKPQGPQMQRRMARPSHVAESRSPHRPSLPESGRNLTVPLRGMGLL
jgi:hypothetical protein